MKFYEFKGEYEFYAMIGVHDGFASPMDLAINEYAEEIEGGMDEYLENYEGDEPVEISEKRIDEGSEEDSILFLIDAELI